jgi:hypothetical protein
MIKVLMMFYLRKTVSCLLFLVSSYVLADQGSISITTSPNIKGCEDLGEVTSRSGQIKSAHWEQHASHRAKFKAKKIGATHLVVESKKNTGVFHGSIKARAYNCHS